MKSFLHSRSVTKIHPMKFTHLILLTALLTACTAAEPPVDPKDLPRLKPTEPAAALKTFTVKPGFHLELAASEPQVVSPVAISFDENGRLFVVEMIDYSERRDERLGRVRILEDLDGDGRYEKSTIFATDIPWPTGIICYDGGVFVMATPDIIYFKDTKGTGKADHRQVVFTGFGPSTGRVNVQGMGNCLTWGLDNRIHGATGPNGAEITFPLAPKTPPLTLRGRDFSFDPKTLTMTPESGGGQYGMSFDNHGRKFVCSNSAHIRAVMYETRYAGRNTFHTLPAPAVDIPADGPAAEVYRTSPDEAWRVIRTKWRVSGAVPGMIEGGGRPSGYFTGATGITIYRGNAWPADMLGDAFIGDAGSNLVHRKKIRTTDGIALLAERPADEQKREFIASSDNWFRPVLFANAPDGTLFIIDMYREVIEHPWSLPANIKQHLDLNSGNDRGRLYRIAPDGFKQPPPPRLGSATTAELVATLAHPNGWHRDTAARLLYQRQDAAAAVPALVELAKSSPAYLGRMHALYALDTLKSLTRDPLLRALADENAWVRRHAIRLSEPLIRSAQTDTALLAKLTSLATDPAPEVRYQLAFTLGETTHTNRLPALAQIASRDGTIPWIREAVLSSIGGDALALFTVSSNDAAFRASKTGREFLQQIVRIIGNKGQAAEVRRILDFLAGLDDTEFSFALIRALGEGMSRGGTSLAASRDALKPFFTRAGQLLADRKTPEPQRVQAAQLHALTSFAESGPRLLALLAPDESPAIQLAAVETLGRLPELDVAKALLQRWETFTPRLRTEALGILLIKSDRLRETMTALEKGAIKPGQLASTQVNFLRSHRDLEIRNRALKFFGKTDATTRQSVIDAFAPALALTGDAARGKAIYVERCASCHRLDGQGFALGPDLVSVKNTGKEKILLNILDPNREVPPNYQAYVIETKNDESFMGLVASETSTSVTLKMAFGKDANIPRSQIKTLKNQGLSLMPEGLEAGLTPQAAADLLEYIMAAKQ
ncbi:cytochrome c [Verrucomicrobiota bacterium]|nr:cytochrome c [Verrucomicrobiota bacterium]